MNTEGSKRNFTLQDTSLAWMARAPAKLLAAPREKAASPRVTMQTWSF